MLSSGMRRAAGPARSSRRVALACALAACTPPAPKDSHDCGPTCEQPAPKDSLPARDACLAAHADAPARYSKIVRAFCSEHAHLAGVGAALAIAEHGALQYTAETGLRCAGGQPVTRDTPFRIGSLTKLLTAALALDVADDALLDLDAPLLELADHPDPRARTISPRQLLRHTSGLPDLAPHDTPHAPWRTTLAARPLWTAPGALWSYSNAGHALVGAALERVTNTPYTDLLTTRITAPLHLAHTTADRDAAIRDDAACGHLGRGPTATPLDIIKDFELGARAATWTTPAGGVLASASDLVDLVLALQDPARSPLSPPARAALLAPDLETHEHPGERAALGLRARPLPTGDHLYRLTGHTGDFTADLSFAPAHGFVFVALTNTGDPLRATLAAAHDLLGHRQTPAPPAPSTAYAGTYTLPDGATITVSPALTLTAPSLQLQNIQLLHTGDHRFHSTTPPLALTFAFTAGPAHATHLRTRTFVATHTSGR